MGFVRLVLLIFHLGVVALLLGTLLNDYVPPRLFGYLNLLSLGFPVLMIVHFLLTLFWIFAWKKRAILFILVSLVFLNPVRRWINYHPNTEKEGTLKIITFNSKNGRLAKKNNGSSVSEFLEKHDADVALLQENFQKGKSEGYLQYPVVALKTKHQILKHKDLIENGTNGHSFYADIDVNGKTIRVVNVYLEPFELEKSMVKPTSDVDVNTAKAKRLIWRLVPAFKKHQGQVKLIRKAIDESPYPVILAGDFNSVPNSWEYYHLGKGLTDAFESVGNGSGTSFHDYKFPIRIDYIFSSKEIKPVSYKVDRSVKISDHFPVIATFDF